MKKFDKNIASNKINNRNNKKLKRNTIIVSVVLLVGAIIYFSFAKYESSFNVHLVNGVVRNNDVVSYITSLKNNGSADLEYDGKDSLDEVGTLENNLRYVGANPNNFIYYNCSTTNINEMNDSTCEKWRIVGLFNDIEDENGTKASRVKIVTSFPLGDYSWDTSESNVDNGSGINQWGESDSYEGADLMRELNTDYLGNITVGVDGKWYNGYNNKKTADMPSSVLNSNAQQMIQTVKWSTGAVVSTNKSYTNVKAMYDYERSNNVGNSVCNYSTKCNDNVVRTTSWVGKVGLLYHSDLGYATMGGDTNSRKDCINSSLDGWIYYAHTPDCAASCWIGLMNAGQYGYDKIYISPYVLEGGSYVKMSETEGAVYTYAFTANSVFPTLYLKSSVRIVSGKGSSSNPYKLSL